MKAPWFVKGTKPPLGTESGGRNARGFGGVPRGTPSGWRRTRRGLKFSPSGGVPTKSGRGSDNSFLCKPPRCFAPPLHRGELAPPGAGNKKVLLRWRSTGRAGEGGEPPSSRPRFAEASHFPLGAELIMKWGVKNTFIHNENVI